MSGHSKWATIHRQKGLNDAKKGAVFTKLGKAISIAVKEGGGVGDPDKNFKLRLVVEKARQANMPKENIERAIDKGLGNQGGEELTEVMYEGFIPGGAAVIVMAVTDNKLRTAQQIREVLDKNGGSLGSQGAVAYLFSQKGELMIKARDEQELEIIDLGVDDIEKENEDWLLYCDKDQTFEIKEKLEKLGYAVLSVELVMKPIATVEINDLETRNKIENILERLEDLDDVQKVWTNYA